MAHKSSINHRKMGNVLQQDKLQKRVIVMMHRYLNAKMC